MDAAAGLVERFWADEQAPEAARRVKRRVRATLSRSWTCAEAAHASQLRRNFLDSPLRAVRSVLGLLPSNVHDHAEYAHRRVSEAGCAGGRDIPKLARTGVRDLLQAGVRDVLLSGDLTLEHPGEPRGRRCARISASWPLTEAGAVSRAELPGFFQRDYAAWARAHLEAGWVPSDTRMDEYRRRIRAVMRAVLRPAAEGISFWARLVRLFDLAPLQRPDQPQLVCCRRRCSTSRGRARARPRPRRVDPASVYRDMDARADRIEGPYAHPPQAEAPRWATMPCRNLRACCNRPSPGTRRAHRALAR